MKHHDIEGGHHMQSAHFDAAKRGFLVLMMKKIKKNEKSLIIYV
jgi:hypothetical protein